MNPDPPAPINESFVNPMPPSARLLAEAIVAWRNSSNMAGSPLVEQAAFMLEMPELVQLRQLARAAIEVDIAARAYVDNPSVATKASMYATIARLSTTIYDTPPCVRVWVEEQT